VTGEAERIDWDVLYLAARSWEIQPSEFWDMTFAEWFCEYDWRRPRDERNDYAGNLTQSDVDRLKGLIDAS
jgi:hypothetical protein